MAEETITRITLPKWTQQTDAILAVAVIGVVVVMILPLPPLVLDIFLSFNITIAIIIMLVAMYIKEPLDFSVFPSLLLIVTLFRLSLNVASTRLILLRGKEGLEAAGEVIRAFGAFVVGGNYVVGAVVFVILIVINFVVITKGADRISEVFQSEATALKLEEENLATALNGADILVNTTSVGMSPNVNETLVTSDLLKPGLVVYDIVYNPIKTKLLKEAEEAGAETIGGLDMLVWQGALAFEKWTGLKAPADLMRREAIKVLEGHED